MVWIFFPRQEEGSTKGCNHDQPGSTLKLKDSFLSLDEMNESFMSSDEPRNATEKTSSGRLRAGPPGQRAAAAQRTAGPIAQPAAAKTAPMSSQPGRPQPMTTVLSSTGPIARATDVPVPKKPWY